MKIVKLLWIDDMEEWAESAIENLEIVAQDYKVQLHVIHKANGEDIVSLLSIDFSGVIMDYHMEPRNGDKYIKEIRFEEHLDFIPIIFYSQDNTANLAQLVEDVKNVQTVYRPNLHDLIEDSFFK